ncbi:FliH/SctL family protein, partial [Alphaproteobacteria bacterium]|nr:FliH/SctL family protein [Alphaproteobacteria bacterium]
GAPIAANFETVTAAFERGKAEGIIAGREAGVAETKAAAEASAQANLADKIAAFEAALVALAKPQALQAEDLSRSIHAAILKLASQRAGQQIDDMPEHFLARIEALVTSIGQKMNAGKVHINADDYKVMLPYLADADFDFVAEPGLARGDIILKFAGVELHDIAESRLGGQYAETAKNKAKAPVEAADLAPKPTPAEPTPAEPTPTDGADMSSPVQNADDGSKDTAAFDTAASDTAQDDPSAAPSDEIASDETPS